MNGQARWRVGIDTGGTFTDLVAVSGEEVRTAKVASTPPRFDEGVIDALAAADVAPAEIEVLAHGTTATTNAVITKGGARTGLITTRGFRDVLELRRHNRGELYDILWDPPPPLVPRRRRIEVTERVDYAGGVLAPLDEEEVAAALERLRDEQIETLAVSFLHSYQNPAHERRVKEIAERVWPGLYVSVSSDLIREPQEFERTSTTVVNAYVGPILVSYVQRLEDRLADGGFEGSLLIMHSGGGLLPARAVLSVPARTVTSGPAAGAIAAEGLAASGAPAAGPVTAGLRHAIGLDMGGTSADIAIIRDGKALLINEYAPEFGLPIRFPAVDLLTIGAGGGSIAWIDDAGVPRVGPQSAGARPGPASYGRGGTEPTVTDANLVLGRLSPETELAGGLRLDADAAREAIAGFAAQLDLSLEEAALGIVDIANSNMKRALRVLTVERGLDPRHFTLVPFGGAGPMHGCELAAELEIPEVLVPVAPGVTSALGTLLADVVHDHARSRIGVLAELLPDEVETIFTELEQEARKALADDRVPPDQQVLERSLDLRYVGQLKALSIPAPGRPFDADAAREARRGFLEEYERRYRYVTEELEPELAVVRVRARGMQRRPVLAAPSGDGIASGPSSRSVRFRTGEVEAAVHPRSSLRPGSELRGPTVVEQPDSVTVVPPDWALRVDAAGNLRLTRRAA